MIKQKQKPPATTIICLEGWANGLVAVSEPSLGRLESNSIILAVEFDFFVCGPNYVRFNRGRHIIGGGLLGGVMCGGVWRGCVVCGVSFPWVENFWCESRFSMGAIYEFLFWGVGLLPLSLRDGRQDTVCVVRRHSLP